MTPDPKKKAVRLRGVAKDRFRNSVAWLNGFRCQYCDKLAGLDFTPHGEIHHIKSIGAGGGDTFENVMWVHRKCHTKIHMGFEYRLLTTK